MKPLMHLLFNEPWPILVFLIAPVHFIARQLCDQQNPLRLQARRLGTLAFVTVLVFRWSEHPPKDSGQCLDIFCRSLLIAWLTSCMACIVLTLFKLPRFRLPRWQAWHWINERRMQSAQLSQQSQQRHLEQVIHELKTECQLLYLRYTTALQNRLPRERFEELLTRTFDHCHQELAARDRSSKLQQTLRELARAPQGEPVTRDVGELFRWKARVQSELLATVPDSDTLSQAQSQLEARFEELLKRTIEESLP